jgi:uncharacterized protein YbjQ (UPF0145 family)
MPWGRRPPDASGSADRDRRQAESIEALEQGQLPREAQDRVGREARGELPWTSTLTVPDFLTCRQLGLAPLGQVMGSSVMHIGFNPQWVYGAWQNGDVRPVSRAMAEARELALDRLRQEAAALGAHGVVSVQLTASRPQWAESIMEFQALGTAVSLPGLPVPERPFLGAVSAQDVEKLWAAGYLPMDLLVATTAYYVMTDWVSQSQEMSWTNQEVQGYSQAVYEARNYVLSGLHAMARGAGADGVLGTEWDLAVEEFEVERPLYGMGPMGGMGGFGVANSSVTDHLLYLTVVGTAIGRMSSVLQHLPPRPALSLSDPGDPTALAPNVLE